MSAIADTAIGRTRPNSVVRNQFSIRYPALKLSYSAFARVRSDLRVSSAISFVSRAHAT